MKIVTSALGATLFLGVSLIGATAHGQVVGDTCDDPVVKVGSGTVDFDMSQMIVPSAPNWMEKECFTSNPSHDIDAYVCWTSDVDGLVEISTCGGTEMNTQLALFQGCACPNEEIQSICCDDNGCDKQSVIRCEVVCDEQYMILLSVVDLSAGPNVTLTINPLGDPCGTPPEHELISCEDCCGAVPPVTGFGGLQAIASQWRVPDLDDPYVIHVFDLDPAGLTPPGTTSSPPTYEHPDWTLDFIGSIFGVAMSGDGTMYGAASSIYSLDFVGSLGGSGSIYRLDGNTGQPSELIELPNVSGAGLGNIAASCDTGLLYASNFEDGLIWAVDPSGNAVDSYRHSDGAALGSVGDPNDVPGYAPLGSRPWAVQPVGSRLYYSVWVEDQNRVDVARNNEVWSIGLDPAGQFLTGTRQFEFSTPDFVWNGFPDNTTSPISDISQGPDCCLYIGERTMFSDGGTGAHRSRVLVACQQEDGSWIVDDTLFQMGSSFIGNSSSGGVAVDYLNDGRVWATADAVSFGGGEVTYGIQGTPRTGGGPDDSIKIDLDDNTIKQDDKSGIGSIDITCIMEDSGPCMTVSNYDTIECVVDDTGPTGEYVVHVEVTNLSDHVAQYLLIPNGQVSPSTILFDPPLNPGGTALFDIVVTGAPLETVCIPMIMFDVEGDQCCNAELCVELPECDCAVLSDIEVGCGPDANGVIQVTFTITNLTADVIEHLFFLPLVGSGDVIDPDHIDIPGLAPLATMTVGPIDILTSAPVGTLHAFHVSLHNETLKECCAEEVPFMVADCGSNSTLGDLNGDGVVDGADLTILLGAWGSSGPGDLNGDGLVDGADLALLLGLWGP
jgi:hypothetical protein